jgi:acyl dehydratase
MTSTTVQAPIDLLNLVGQPLGVSSWHEITQDQVNMFAEATGDRQWIHTDPIRAAAGPFGGPIVHGYLTLALAPVVIAEVVAVDNVLAALNYGVNKVRFPAPVPVGGRVRGVVRLAGAQQRPAGIEAVFTVAFELDGSDRPACVAEVVAIYR